MAVPLGGPNEEYTGKFGKAVGYVWRGKHIIRKYTKKVSNPRTDAQVLVREKFKLLSKVCVDFMPAIRVGLEKASRKKNSIPRAEFFHLNYGLVEVASTGEIKVDITRLKLSEGSLGVVSFGNADFDTPQKVQADITDDGMLDPKALSTDEVIMVAYCPAMEQIAFGVVATRISETAEIDIPTLWQGQTLYIYGFLRCKEGRYRNECSRTVFIGSGTAE